MGPAGSALGVGAGGGGGWLGALGAADRAPAAGLGAIAFLPLSSAAATRAGALAAATGGGSISTLAGTASPALVITTLTFLSTPPCESRRAKMSPGRPVRT